MYQINPAAGLKIFTLGLIAVALVALALFAAGSASAHGASPHATMILDATDSYGDCAAVGNWDQPNLICALNQDVTGALIIEGDDITLDGNGHRTDGGFASPPGGNVGVFVLNYDGITIKNLDIGGDNLPNGSISLHWGVYTKYSDNLTVSNATMKVKNQGIINFGHPSCHYNDPRYNDSEGD